MMMKYLLVLGLTGLVFSSCAGTEPNQIDEVSQQVKGIYKDIPAEKFKANYVKGFLLDVRTPEEFAEGHIQGAVNIDIYDAQFSSQLDKLDKSKPVYVYCRSGARSSNASEMMKKKGFKEVYNLIGGYAAYPFK